MLNPLPIRAITLDLDDTLWPIWPTIERAESALQQWLQVHAPATAMLLRDDAQRKAIRQRVHLQWPGMSHDLTFLRRASIRLALQMAGEPPDLDEPAFEVFFAARQSVTLYPEALDALARLSAHFPVLSLSNGNADVHRVGLGPYFTGMVTAREVGHQKPDVRIFQHAAERLAMPPEAILHVGDDWALDVLGGLAAGMQCAWINRHEQAVPDHPPTMRWQMFTDLKALCERLGLAADR